MSTHQEGSDQPKKVNGFGRKCLGGGRRVPPNGLMIMENAARIAAAGLKSPLQVLVEIANDPLATRKEKIAASGLAAPYMHRRLPVAMEHTGANGKPLAPPVLNVSFGNQGESVTKTEVVSPEEAFAEGVGVGANEQAQEQETNSTIGEMEEVTDAEVTEFKKTGT